MNYKQKRKIVLLCYNLLMTVLNNLSIVSCPVTPEFYIYFFWVHSVLGKLEISEAYSLLHNLSISAN